jgi:hypothetical protein
MKNLVFVLGLFFAQLALSQELCGAPVLPYGCDVDVCTVELSTTTGKIPLRVDHESLIRDAALVRMAQVGGTQCFEGYFLNHGFTITGFAD